jgi:hypothetical protein
MENSGMHTVTGGTGTGTLSEPIGIRRMVKEYEAFTSIYQATWHNIPDSILETHCCENVNDKNKH